MKLTTPIMIALAPFVATPSHALDEGRKMRSLFLIAAAFVIFGCATTSAQNAVPSHIANAVADQDRPDENRQSAQDTLTLDALAQNDRQYSDGPVTEVDYIQVEYGHFAEYIDWLNSTWKPTMEAMKKGGLIIDYKVFQASPKSPDQPNIFLYLTFKNMAAYGGNIGDKGIEQEYVARKVIGSTEFQNKKRVERSEYRKVLGIELIREIILK
jgi:L-rhamnose mutarotase